MKVRCRKEGTGKDFSGQRGGKSWWVISRSWCNLWWRTCKVPLDHRDAERLWEFIFHQWYFAVILLLIWASRIRHQCILASCVCPGACQLAPFQTSCHKWHVNLKSWTSAKDVLASGMPAAPHILVCSFHGHVFVGAKMYACTWRGCCILYPYMYACTWINQYVYIYIYTQITINNNYICMSIYLYA